MNRYHINIGFKAEDIQALQYLVNRLNSEQWRYTAHCLDNIKHRFIDKEKLLYFIRDLKLEFKNVFEFYTMNGDINKFCYRINYEKNIDIILVIGYNKELITIYMNSTDDQHDTLKAELYTKVG
jgi:hypothetical protein